MHNAKFLVLASGLLTSLSTAAYAATVDTSVSSAPATTSSVSLDGGTTVFDFSNSSNDIINIDLSGLQQNRHDFSQMIQQVIGTDTPNNLLTTADMNFINELPGHSGFARLIHAMEQASASGSTATGNELLVLMPGVNDAVVLSLPPTSSSAIPEPTTPMLIGGAGLAMVTGRRRPKKS